MTDSFRTNRAMALALIAGAAVTCGSAVAAGRKTDAEPRPANRPATLPSGAIRRFGNAFFCGPSDRFSFSPDGTLLAAAAGRRVEVVDVATGRSIRRFDDHAASVHTVAFSADGRTLFVSDGNVTYWDVKTGKKVGFHDLDARVGQLQLNRAAVSADRKWIASIWRDGQIRVARWNAAYPKQAVSVNRFSRVLAISRNGDLFAADHREATDYKIRVWDRTTWKLVREFPGHTSPIGGLAFSPDGRTIFSGGYDGRIMAWDLTKVRQGPPIRESKSTTRPRPVMSLAVSPDGKTIAAGISRDELLLIDVATRKIRHRIRGFLNYIRAIEFSPDGSLVTAAGRGTEIPLFDTTTGKPRFAATGHFSAIIDTSVASDGKKFATLGRAGYICIWNAADGRLIRRSRGVFRMKGSLNSGGGKLHFMPDGCRIAVLRGGQRVLLWNSETDTVVATIPSKTVAPVVAASPHGFFARAVRGGTIEIPSAQFHRNVAVEQRPLRLKGHRGGVSAMAISPDGSLLVSTGIDRTLRVWRLKDGALTKRIPTKAAAAVAVIAPDGKRVATAAGNAVHVRDLSSGRPVADIKTAIKAVHAVAFSSDGKRLVTAGNGRDIEIWDAETGKRLRQIRCKDPEIHAVSFSPDGKRLAAGGAEKVIRVFEIARSREIVALAGHLACVTALRFVSKERLASGSRGGEVFLSDTSKPGKPPRRWQLRYAISDLMVSPANGYLMAVAADAELLRFDATSDTDRGRMLMMDSSDSLRGMRFSPDGRRVALVLREGLRIVDVDDGKVVAAMPGADPLFSADGNRLYFTASPRRGGFVAWDLAKKKEVFSIPPETSGRARIVAEFPGGTRFLSQSVFGRVIRIWDAKTQRPVQTLSFKPTGQGPVTLTEGRIDAHTRGESVVLRRLRLSPDGRLIAGIRSGGTLELRELLTGRLVFRLPKTSSSVVSFSFLDGDTIVTGMSDGTALAWSLRPIGLDRTRLTKNADRKLLNDLWRDLQSSDPATAERAFHSFVLLGSRAVTDLRARLNPATGDANSRKRIEALIAQLNDRNPRVRKSASEKLRQFGNAAVPSLRDALKGKLSPSARVRIKLLIAAKPPATKVDLRSIRAIWILQRIGTAEAKAVLGKLANGNPSARMTQSAKMALQFLSRRR